MRFLVLGAGAMGSLIGGLLAAKHDVTLVARRAHVDAVRREGLRIRGRTEAVVRVRAVEHAAEAEPPDVAVVTVKSYDTGAAADALRPFAERALLLSLQNGLGNVERLAATGARVLGGVTYHGVTFVGSGEVNHAGEGDTILGPFAGTTAEDAERVAAAFSECGIHTRATDDLPRVLWTKAVVNACFNPITGLLRVRSGALARNEALLACCRAVVEEAAAVAGACGTPLDVEALMERVLAVSAATAENRSSMLQDLEKGRRTEIDAINGAIHRLGEERGIACPVNRTLALLVRAAEEIGGAARA